MYVLDSPSLSPFDPYYLSDRLLHDCTSTIQSYRCLCVSFAVNEVSNPAETKSTMKIFASAARQSLLRRTSFMERAPR
jgi:hypothetical protein